MSDILVRDVSAEVVELLKARAARNGRSLQREVTIILEGAVLEEARRKSAIAAANEIRGRLAATGRDFGDSVELLREDRQR